MNYTLTCSPLSSSSLDSLLATSREPALVDIIFIFYSCQQQVELSYDGIPVQIITE